MKAIAIAAVLWAFSTVVLGLIARVTYLVFMRVSRGSSLTITSKISQ